MSIAARLQQITDRHAELTALMSSGELEGDKFVEVSKAKGSSSPKSSIQLSVVDVEAVTPEYEAYQDEHESHGRQRDADEFNSEDFEAYVGAQVSLPVGDRMELATVRYCTFQSSVK